MTAHKRRLIGSAADEIRKALDLPDGDFNIEEVVSRLNGFISYFSGYEAGMTEEVVKSGGQEFSDVHADFVIRINEGNVKTRQRFSIAHELGHLFLHMRYLTDTWYALPAGKSYQRELGSYSMTEEEANEFAGAFLMPEHHFVKIANETSSNTHYILDKIAQHFNVSISAASNRGRNLGLWR